MMYLYLLFFICDLSTVFTEFHGMKQNGMVSSIIKAIQIPVEAFVKILICCRPRCSHTVIRTTKHLHEIFYLGNVC